MSRPSTLKKDNTLYWVLRTYNTSGVLVDADSTPTVAVRKNGASVADAVTVTKRAATTGIYDCSYNPASEVEGDQYTLEESATVSAQAYENSWETNVISNDVDVVSISGDTVAADNLELQYDGTGLTGDTFPATQSQFGGLATGAGGLSATAGSFTLTTGTQSVGTVTSTEEKDTTVHTIVPATAIIDCYYEFNVGVTGKCTEVIWDGYVGNNSDVVNVYGWDWISSSWKQVGTISGKNANTVEEQIFIFTTAMTGTAADIGKVRCRFESSGVNVAVDLNTDRILCEYTSIAAEQFILHSGVAQGGTTNTITLDATADAADDFYNHAAVLVVSGTGVEQERVIVDYNGTTKVATIAPPWVTLPNTTSAFEVKPATVHAETGWATIKVGLVQAATANTITLASDASSVNDYYDGDLIKIDAGTGEGQIRVVRGYNGTTKVATIDPPWDTQPDATSEYILEDSHPYLTSLVSHGGTAQAGTTNTITLDANASSADQFYTHERIEIVGGTGDGQQAIVTNYNGTTKVATVAPPWGVTPDATSRFQISPALCHAETSSDTIKIGLAVAATATTITLDSLASSVDDYYNGDIVVLDKGTGAGQRRMVSDYNGTTKVATLSVAWTTTPDTTSEYVVSVGHPWSPEWDSPAAIAVWDAQTSSYTAAGSLGKAVGDLGADVTSVLADTNELQLNQGNWLTATGFNTIAPDNASITAILADTNELQLNQGGWLTATGFATPADIAGLNDPTAAAIADAVWDEATSGHNAAGSFGKALRQVKEGLVTVESTVNDASATTTSFVTALTEASSSFYSDKVLVFISGQLTGQSRIITSYNGTTKAVAFDEPLSYTPADGDEFIILSMHEHSVSQIADGVWDEPQSGHVTAGTFGAYLDSAVSAAGGGGLTAAAIADAVWDELSSEHIVLGSFGAYIDAAISTVSSSGSGLYQVSVRIQDAALNALQGAYVSIDGTTITLVTDPTGEVTFNLDSGNYTLTVLPPAGYTMPANQSVTVSDADPAQTVFTLSATAASGCDVTWVG